MFVFKLGFPDSSDAKIVDENISVLKNKSEFGFVPMQEGLEEGGKLWRGCTHLKDQQIIKLYYTRQES